MLLFVLLLLSTQGSARADCASVEACRQAALEAAAQQDYESFHDLAWRAVQKGRPTDSELMYLLARAQSLSGRPGDALVMLGRLAERGIVTDAPTNDDFKRVRALPGWPAFAAIDSELRQKSTAAPGDAPRAASPSAAPAAARAVTGPEKTTAREEEEAIHFVAPPFAPAGFAYDGVSRRFIAGVREARKLVVIDEPSHHVSNLAAAQSAGFGEIAALEIDKHEGDLWVATGDGGSSVLHKLQLVSGRVIYSVDPPSDAGPVHFVDVAVAPQSTILALDGTGSRLFALRRGSRTLNLAATLTTEDPVSVAPATDSVAFVSSSAGLTRVDLAARRETPVSSPHNIDLSGLTRIRMHRGAIVGIQKTADGGARAIRLRLNAAGTRVRSLDVLEANVSPFAEVTASIDGNVLYYLSGADGDAAVHRVRLR